MLETIDYELTTLLLAFFQRLLVYRHTLVFAP